jgi:hypothetical protein
MTAKMILPALTEATSPWCFSTERQGDQKTWSF